MARKKPETLLQNEIIKLLRNKEWYVRQTHGNMFSSGWPDLYAAHLRYGTRWIEVKMPENYAFTAAQLDDFPEFAAKGVGIWIIQRATDEEYSKLFKPPNWHMHLEIMKAGHHG